MISIIVSLIQYFLQAVAQTFVQLFVVFGVGFTLAVILWFVSQGMRGCAGGRFGMAYYWFVAPGVACHETGHALGCVITRTRILKFVPFHPSPDGTLGYVSHAEPNGGNFLGNMASFVIATGPVWFGSSVIIFLSWLMGGNEFFPNFKSYFLVGTPLGICDYISAVFSAGFEMLKNVTCFWQWRSVWIVLYVYFVFCIASEITLSNVDLEHMCKGMAVIVFVLFALNLIPFVGDLINGVIVYMKPMFFVAHVVLAFVLMLDVIFFVIVWCLSRIWGKR